MSRTKPGAGDVVGWTLAVVLAGCGGSSEIGLFGAGGYPPFDASTDRGTVQQGGAAGAGGNAPDANNPNAGDAYATDAYANDTNATDASSNDSAFHDAVTDPRGDARSDASGRDAPVTDTAPVGDAGVRDAASDATRDAVTGVDACSPTGGGVERCDGIDNDCDGRIDEPPVCPTGCIGASHAGRGYMFCYTPMARRAWQAAESACENSGMHLVRVDDAAENTFIRTTADGVNHSGIVWIGGNDVMTELRWVWTDGTPFWMGGPGGMPIDNRYSNWAPGEPDDGNRNIDCVAMRDGDDRWRDVNCAMRHAYVCEE